MLTDKDINRILAVVATKQDIQRVEEGINEIKKTQQGMLSALDRLATTIEKLNLEYAAMSEQLARHERWIKQIAKQSGVSLKD
jgi:archaellum component FlaC